MPIWNPDVPRPSRRAMLIAVPAALLAWRLPLSGADETDAPATPTAEPPEAERRELATFALG